MTMWHDVSITCEVVEAVRSGLFHVIPVFTAKQSRTNKNQHMTQFAATGLVNIMRYKE